MNSQRKSAQLVTTAFLLIVSLASIAQTSEFTRLTNSKDFESALQKTSLELTSIKADFTQSKQLQFLESELKSGGKFWFKAPGKVRWEYTYPYSYAVIISDGRLNLISEDSKNEFDMNSSKVFEQLNELILAAVSGNILSSPHYKAENFENKDTYLVILTPLTENVSAMISRIEIYFDKKALRVNQLRMVEANTDFSLISFTNQLFNETIPDTVFSP
jgi:outer membrane lipoprotein-sorting protein